MHPKFSAVEGPPAEADVLPAGSVGEALERSKLPKHNREPLLTSAMPSKKACKPTDLKAGVLTVAFLAGHAAGGHTVHD